MLAEFTHTLRNLRGQIIGWSIGLILYGVLMVLIYDTITTIEGFEEIIASYPPEMVAFFGDMYELTTPKGYLDTYYFSMMTVIIGIFAVGAGAKLLVGDEEAGILDLVMAHPISRSALFWGRLLGFVAALFIILTLSWLSWVVPSGATGLDLTWIEFLRPFAPLFALLLIFATLALMFSLLLPAVRQASMLAGGLLVGNFLLVGLASLNDSLETAVKLTPFHYFQGGDAVLELNWSWLGGLLLVAFLLALLAWWRFLQRDIRVGGEGGWEIPALLRWVPGIR